MVGALWLACVLGGMGFLLKYSSAAGLPGRSPVEWPPASAIVRAPGRSTLLMFVHPKCPCSRASIDELSRLMAVASDRLVARVLVWTPPNAGDDWSQTFLVRAAAAIPGVTVERDERGREGERFFAQTSGHTVVYSDGGRLLFSGGITALRGHSGDNEGRSSILALIDGRPGSARTPVFGCPLMADEKSRP